MGTTKSNGRGRQIELAIEELAAVLADPALTGSARAWLSWSQSGDFGYRQEHWGRLAENVGKRLAKAGWPEGQTEAMTEFLAWARPRRGSNMSDFNEGGFLREALRAGLAAGPDAAAALRWAERMEQGRKAHVASLPPRTLTDRERSESFERMSFPDLELTKEMWETAARQSPWAAEALFGSAARAYSAAFASDKVSPERREEAWRGAVGLAKAMPKEDLNKALRGLFTTFDRGEKKKEARAALCSELCALGADWTASIAHPRTGRLESAIDLLVDEGNAFAARAALKDLGPEKFWPQMERTAKEWLISARRGLELARWVGEIGPGAKEAARLALRAASLGTQDDDAKMIKDAFEAAGEAAELRGASPWLFAGFADPAEPSSWTSRSSSPQPLAPRGEKNPRRWLVDSRGRAQSAASADSALGELMRQLSKRGVQAPWAADQPELKELPDAVRALIERWEIAASLDPADLPEGRKGAPRV